MKFPHRAWLVYNLYTIYEVEITNQDEYNYWFKYKQKLNSNCTSFKPSIDKIMKSSRLLYFSKKETLAKLSALRSSACERATTDIKLLQNRIDHLNKLNS